MKSFKLFMEEQERPLRGEISAIEAVGRYLLGNQPKTEEKAKTKFDDAADEEYRAYRKKVEQARINRRRGRRNP